MTKRQAKQIFRIVFIAVSIGSLYFVPWILVKAWILPLPDTVQEQVEEVRKVKRYRNAIIEDPLKMGPELTLKEAKKIMDKHGISSTLIVDQYNELIGILTSRDIRFRPSDDVLISELMTPREKLITATPLITAPEAKDLLMENRIEKLPLVNEDWTLAGLITGKDLHKRTLYPNDSLDRKNRLLVGAAIGVKSDSIDRAEELIDAGVDFLVIDIAHGHSDIVIDTIFKLKEKWPDTDIIAGNVCTPEGTRDLIKAGADAIKIGVGPGANCSTRIVTGSGYPQVSAIIECSKIAEEYNIPIIADGGVKNSGDMMKAISAGTDTIMIGSLISGTRETPGNVIVKDGHKYKLYRGMASKSAKDSKDNKDKKKQDDEYVPEGVESIIPYRGTVKEIIIQLLGGVKSGMSYCGAHTISEAKGLRNFVKITAAGMKESIPHNQYKQ